MHGTIRCNSESISTCFSLPASRRRGWASGQGNSAPRTLTGSIEFEVEVILAIEGLDASGKNTQTQLLTARARGAGLSVGTLAFPRYGETLFAASVADYLNGKFGDLTAVDP